MLNIAALPVLTIVLRNNLMKLFTPKLFPSKSFEITRYYYLITNKMDISIHYRHIKCCIY